MIGKNRGFLSWAALGLGGVLLVGSFFEFLHLAEKQQQLGFPRSAALLRAVVIAELVLVVITAAVVWRSARRATALVIIAGVVLLLGVVDVIFTAQTGVIP